MVVCLEEELLPYIPQASEGLLKGSDIQSIQEYIPLIVQIIAKFKVSWFLSCRVWGSHSGSYECCHLLGVHSAISQKMVTFNSGVVWLCFNSVRSFICFQLLEILCTYCMCLLRPLK
jgi:hypothetical protein